MAMGAIIARALDAPSKPKALRDVRLNNHPIGMF
jgi:hypothetical protein